MKGDMVLKRFPELKREEKNMPSFCKQLNKDSLECNLEKGDQKEGIYDFSIIYYYEGFRTSSERELEFSVKV